MDWKEIQADAVRARSTNAPAPSFQWKYDNFYAAPELKEPPSANAKKGDKQKKINQKQNHEERKYGLTPSDHKHLKQKISLAKKGTGFVLAKLREADKFDKFSEDWYHHTKIAMRLACERSRMLLSFKHKEAYRPAMDFWDTMKKYGFCHKEKLFGSQDTPGILEPLAEELIQWEKRYPLSPVQFARKTGEEQLYFQKLHVGMFEGIGMRQRVPSTKIPFPGELTKEFCKHLHQSGPFQELPWCQLGLLKNKEGIPAEEWGEKVVHIDRVGRAKVPKKLLPDGYDGKNSDDSCIMGWMVEKGYLPPWHATMACIINLTNEKFKLSMQGRQGRRDSGEATRPEIRQRHVTMNRGDACFFLTDTWHASQPPMGEKSQPCHRLHAIGGLYNRLSVEIIEKVPEPESTTNETKGKPTNESNENLDCKPKARTSNREKRKIPTKKNPPAAPKRGNKSNPSGKQSKRAACEPERKRTKRKINAPSKITNASRESRAGRAAARAKEKEEREKKKRKGK